MSNIYYENEQWKHINKNIIASPNQIDLETFRSGAVNSKISTWDPAANGVRYMKTCVYLSAQGFDSRRWAILDRITNRLLGAPHVVTIGERPVCLDYLMAVDEVAFLIDETKNIRSVVEIGAGFGRTSHALLCNIETIESYTIIDLPNCLELSRRYLRAVLSDEQFAKIRFVLNTECGDVQDRFDLAINIDSMAEMDASVVDAYFAWIDSRCRLFYSKNPLGKYRADSAGAIVNDQHALGAAMLSGKLRCVVDMFNSSELDAQVPNFYQAYAPGPNWRLTKGGSTIPWAFHHQAIFERQ